MRIKETRKERIQRTAGIWKGAKNEYWRGALMKKASLLREVLSLSSQWDASSSNRREYLYIAVIMGCNDFVNGGNKERNGSLVPRCHLLFFLGSLLVFCFLPQMKTRGVKVLRPTQHCLTTNVHGFLWVPLLYLHRSSVNGKDHLLQPNDHPRQNNC